MVLSRRQTTFSSVTVLTTSSVAPSDARDCEDCLAGGSVAPAYDDKTMSPSEITAKVRILLSKWTNEMSHKPLWKTMRLGMEANCHPPTPVYDPE